MAVLSFSHGGLVKNYNKILHGPGYKNNDPAPYCSISGMEIEGKLMMHVHDLYDGHLEPATADPSVQYLN